MVNSPLLKVAFGYLSGSVKMTFKLKDDYNWKYATIEIAENFALPPLKGKCTELYDDNYAGGCRIETPVWLDEPVKDLLTYEPIRIFDIDFDSDDEIIIGTIGGNRMAHEYKIFELEFGEDTVKAIPTISFRELMPLSIMIIRLLVIIIKCMWISYNYLQNLMVRTFKW